MIELKMPIYKLRKGHGREFFKLNSEELHDLPMDITL